MKAVNLEKLLPSDIPPGERILWHGRPDWVSLTRRAFRADLVAAYFAATTVWNAGSIGYESGGAAGAMAAAKTMAAGVAAICVLSVLGWLSSRTSLYVITSRRLVMKVGIALPVFFNLPFSRIASASARIYSDGTGDIPVALSDGERIAYLQLWPHARPFRTARPEPALRGVRNGAAVASTLSQALAAFAQQNGTAHTTESVRPQTASAESPRPAEQTATA